MAALQTKRRDELHLGTQTASWWFILGHTHQHQHTLHPANSSTQTQFGCPANPALVVHALEHLRLCCSILLVRGIWDNEHKTLKTVPFVVRRAAEKYNPFLVNTLRHYKTERFERLRFKSNGATNYTLARQQPAGGSFWDTHTNNNTHYTASSSIQAPFGCPATPLPVVHALERLRLCCSILLVRGIWANEHITQQKHFTPLCPGLQKKAIPPRKTLLVLTKP